MNPEQMYSDIRQALQSVEPGSQLDQVLQRWRGFDHIVRANEKWLLEGFVSFFQSHYELARAVDPSLEPGLPPQCFDPEAIAQFFRLTPDAFSESREDVVGTVRKPGRPSDTRSIGKFVHEHREQGLTMKEIFVNYREMHPDDKRVTNMEQMRGAYRRWVQANR